LTNFYSSVKLSHSIKNSSLIKRLNERKKFLGEPSEKSDKKEKLSK